VVTPATGETDDFTPLTSSGHWLGWLGDDPARAVREEIEAVLRQQVPTAQLSWVRLVDKPYYLTGGRKQPHHPTKVILTRAALAVPFELQVRSAGRVDELRGVFSWVATGLDGARRDRIHFDLDAEFTWASEQLRERIYELDEPAEAPPGP
jgi:hypothetical protein